MTTIKPTNYTLLKKQAASLIEDEHHMIAILSNMSALLNDNLDQVNWVGFYLKEQDELILGPFQGHLVSTFQLEKVYVVQPFLSAALKLLLTSTNLKDISLVMLIVSLKLSFQFSKMIKLSVS